MDVSGRGDYLIITINLYYYLFHNVIYGIYCVSGLGILFIKGNLRGWDKVNYLEGGTSPIVTLPALVQIPK